MVTPGLFLLAAAQAASPSAPQAEICTMLTPRGDVVRAAALAWSSDGSRLGLVPVPGGIWPREAIVGMRRTAETRGARPRFVFGDSSGVILEFGDRFTGRPARAVTLFRNAAAGPYLPLAYGYCEFGPAPQAEDAADTSTQPASVGAGIPAFDPALWPERDCAMLLGDGRRVRITFDLRDGGGVALTSPELWGERRIVAAIGWSANGVGVFDNDGGPTGTAVSYGTRSVSSVARLIRFERIGGRTATNLSGYAFCGAATTVRRAVAQ